MCYAFRVSSNCHNHLPWPIPCAKGLILRNPDPTPFSYFSIVSLVFENPNDLKKIGTDWGTEEVELGSYHKRYVIRFQRHKEPQRSMSKRRICIFIMRRGVVRGWKAIFGVNDAFGRTRHRFDVNRDWLIWCWEMENDLWCFKTKTRLLENLQYIG